MEIIGSEKVEMIRPWNKSNNLHCLAFRSSNADWFLEDSDGFGRLL